MAGSAPRALRLKNDELCNVRAMNFEQLFLRLTHWEWEFNVDDFDVECRINEDLHRVAGMVIHLPALEGESTLRAVVFVGPDINVAKNVLDLVNNVFNTELTHGF